MTAKIYLSVSILISLFVLGYFDLEVSVGYILMIIEATRKFVPEKSPRN